MLVHVDILGPPPPCVDKRGLFADPPPPLLVHVVVECPLRILKNQLLDTCAGKPHSNYLPDSLRIKKL